MRRVRLKSGKFGRRVPKYPVDGMMAHYRKAGPGRKHRQGRVVAGRKLWQACRRMASGGPVGGR